MSVVIPEYQCLEKFMVGIYPSLIILVSYVHTFPQTSLCQYSFFVCNTVCILNGIVSVRILVWKAIEDDMEQEGVVDVDLWKNNDCHRHNSQLHSWEWNYLGISNEQVRAGTELG